MPHLTSGETEAQTGSALSSLSGLSPTGPDPVCGSSQALQAPQRGPKCKVASGQPLGKSTCLPGAGREGHFTPHGQPESPHVPRKRQGASFLSGLAEDPGSTVIHWPRTQDSALNQAATPCSSHFKGLSRNEKFHKPPRPLALSKTWQSSIPPPPERCKHSGTRSENKSTNTQTGTPKADMEYSRPHTRAMAL